MLVGPFLVANAPAEARDAQTANLDQPSVDVGASLRARQGRQLGPQRHPCHVGRRQARVVVPQDVQDRNVATADEVLEVVERQVAAREDLAALQRWAPFAVSGLLHLVGARPVTLLYLLLHALYASAA